MKITDPIADLLTRIRNAIHARHEEVDVPFSKMKKEIVRLLKEEGFIKSFEVVTNEKKHENIKIILKYDAKGQNLISEIKRVSKPGKKIYVAKSEIPKTLRGFGICILSTSKGILTGRQARMGNVGGELLCQVS